VKPHLVYVFPAFGGGGPEVRTCEIINRTAEIFHHTVISLCDDISAKANLDRQYQVQCSAHPNATIRSMADTLRSLKPDLILTHGWGGTDAIIAARLAGIHRIIHLEDGFLDDEAHRQKTARRLARRFVFQAASMVVVPSVTLRAIARKHWRVAQRRLKYIPNGVDMERFFPHDTCQKRHLRESVGLADDAIIIGTVGGLRPVKNQMRLLHAFAQLADKVQNAHLLIVGDGPLLETLKRETGALGIENRVTFAGHIGEPSKLYQVMDVFALSSDSEQMPLSVLEAMASGLPVASTDVGDVRGMLAPENHPWITPATDEHALSNALQELALARNLRLEIGGANRRKCRAEYSIDRMLGRYVTLFQHSAACTAN
jgi:glycosyltransferase involved in cell wall biosynthesis